VTALALATAPLKALKERNNIKDGTIDDVVLGCVDPVGEAGGDNCANGGAGRRLRATTCRASRSTASAASGIDAVNFAAAQVMSGQHAMTIRRRVPNRLSRIGIGASGGAWPMDPDRSAVPAYFMPQERIGRSDRDQIRLFPRRRRRLCGCKSQQRAAKAWDEGRFKNSVVPVKDVNGLTILAKDEHMRPTTTMQSLGQLQPSFVTMGQMGGFDDGGDPVASGNRAHQLRAPCRQLVGHRRWRRRRAGRQQGSRRQGRPQAARQDSRLRQYRLGTRDDADRRPWSTSPGKCWSAPA